MSRAEINHSKIHFLIRSIVLVLAGALIGGGMSHLHGQPSPSRSVTGSTQFHDTLDKMEGEQLIVMTTKVAIMESTVAETSRKVDKLQSQADTTDARELGIGAAITFLQLLGFITPKKEAKT